MRLEPWASVFLTYEDGFDIVPTSLYMKRISHIRELMLSAAFITLVLGASQIMWAESVMDDSDYEEHRLKEEAAWINKRMRNAE